MQDEQLFGVSVGALCGVDLQWSQSSRGENQRVTLRLQWQSRRPTTITAWIPEDQQIGGYVSRCNDVVINGSWMHKGRLAHALHKVVDGWIDLGAEVKVAGTKIPAAY